LPRRALTAVALSAQGQQKAQLAVMARRAAEVESPSFHLAATAKRKISEKFRTKFHIFRRLAHYLH